MSGYYSRQEVSISQLLELRRSPAHYVAARRGTGRAPTPAMLLGTAVHRLVLEPHLGLDGLKLTPAARDKAHAMATAVAECREARDLLAAHPQREVELYHEGRRGKLDAVGADSVLDLKTCRSAAPGDFTKAAYNLSYEARLSYYCDLAGLSPAAAYVIAVESSEPYVVQCYRYTDDALARGRELWESLLVRAAEVEAMGYEAAGGLGYVPGIAELGLPRWATDSDDEEEGWTEE